GCPPHRAGAGTRAPAPARSAHLTASGRLHPRASGGSTLGSPRARVFARINFLVTSGRLTSEAGNRCHAFLELRNEASHPRSPTILIPAVAVSLLRVAAASRRC